MKLYNLQIYLDMSGIFNMRSKISTKVSSPQLIYMLKVLGVARTSQIILVAIAALLTVIRCFC